jgi:hypothetical protein
MIISLHLPLPLVLLGDVVGVLGVHEAAVDVALRLIVVDLVHLGSVEQRGSALHAVGRRFAQIYKTKGGKASHSGVSVMKEEEFIWSKEASADGLLDAVFGLRGGEKRLRASL